MIKICFLILTQWQCVCLASVALDEGKMYHWKYLLSKLRFFLRVKQKAARFCRDLDLLFLLQGKAGDSMGVDDSTERAGSPLFVFVNENIFKKETFLGKCPSRENILGNCTISDFSLLILNPQWL